MCLPIIRMQTCQATESQTADRRHWYVHKHYRVVYTLLTAGGGLFARPSGVDVCVCVHVCVCTCVRARIQTVQPAGSSSCLLKTSYTVLSVAHKREQGFSSEAGAGTRAPESCFR